MKISRFYQAGTIKVSEELTLSPENHRHAVKVLRLKLEESLILFNGKGGEYLATLSAFDKRTSQVFIQSFININRESPLKITLALATIKPDKMDFAIQKAVELGVSTIQPVVCKRSVINIKANRLKKKMQHWEGVILSACEQSGRTTIPQIKEPIRLNKALNNYSDGVIITMLPTANDKLATLRSLDVSKGVTLFIGPEGGFTDDEEQLMSQHSLNDISFGSRILRAETATIAGITACQLQWGDL